MSLHVARKLAYKLKFKAIAMFPPEDKRNFAVYEGPFPKIVKILVAEPLILGLPVASTIKPFSIKMSYSFKCNHQQ